MANQHGFECLGTLALNDDLNLVIRNEDYSFTPSHADIWDVDARATIQTDLAITVIGGAGSVIADELFALTTSLALTVGNGFAEGKTYQLIIKNASGQTVATNNWELGPRFAVGHAATIEGDTQFITRTEQLDSAAQLLPNTVLGRLLTLEMNQTMNLSPKLRRILAYLGENQVVDAAFFDNASNVVSMRVRGYDTEDNARAAVRWVDTENESDPVGAFPTTGELFRNVILASHDNPRQLRTELLGSIAPEDGGSGDANDQQYDTTSVLD